MLTPFGPTIATLLCMSIPNSTWNYQVKNKANPEEARPAYIFEQVRLVFIVEVNVVKPKNRWRQA